jgi:hypothetical protein
MAAMQTRAWGTTDLHVRILLLTVWWSFGLVNLVYAAIAHSRAVPDAKTDSARGIDWSDGALLVCGVAVSIGLLFATAGLSALSVPPPVPANATQITICEQLLFIGGAGALVALAVLFPLQTRWVWWLVPPLVLESIALVSLYAVIPFSLTD